MLTSRSVLALAAVLTLALAPGRVANAQDDGPLPPPPTGHVHLPPPVPRPALKTPKRNAYPFKPWSYARAYTYNFFRDQPVQMRVLSSTWSWSSYIRSEQAISDDEALRAARLVARTRGTIETTKCTFPRHAIVYFDQDEKPVATVDVCFDCEAVIASPDYPKRDDHDFSRAISRFEAALPAWRKLFENDLRLPIDYRQTPGAQQSP